MRTIGEMVWPVRSESKFYVYLHYIHIVFVLSKTTVKFECQKQKQASFQSFQGCPLLRSRIVAVILYRSFYTNHVPEYYFHTRQIKQKSLCKGHSMEHEKVPVMSSCPLYTGYNYMHC